MPPPVESRTVDEEPYARVIADTSEPLDLLELLRARHLDVQRKRLAPADFIVGATAIERKTVGDFQSSLIDKRLFEQLARIKDTYEPPHVLILEGDLAFVEEFQNPRAFWGALASVAVDFSMTIIPTQSKGGTAEVIAALSRRAGRAGQRSIARYKPRRLGEDAEQKFAVQGLPGVGDIMSKKLLAHFGSLRNVFAATQAELSRAPGVGPKRAAEIAAFLDRPFAEVTERRGEQAKLPSHAEDDV